jgi:DegV family protein with EDD domain
MPATVVVVTDSTSYLPEGLAERHGLVVVPLQVVITGRSLAEGVEVTSAQVAQALLAGQAVTTSRPAPASFARTYRELAGDPARSAAIVSVHLSGELSGTVDAARVAAREVAADGITVEVVDARSMGLGLGFAALAAARAAAQCQSAVEVALAAARCGHATGIWLYVDTLEYLRRGGRIGAASALLGSALSVKPLLHLVDGRIEPLERVRTASRALARLEEIVLAEAGDRAVDVGVQHLAAPERAEALAARLRGRLPGVRDLHVAEVGAVVGAHVGPGMLGVVIAPAG